MSVVGGWFGWVGMSKEEKRKKEKKVGESAVFYSPTPAYGRAVTRQTREGEKQREQHRTARKNLFIFTQRQRHRDTETHRGRSLLKFQFHTHTDSLVTAS